MTSPTLALHDDRPAVAVVVVAHPDDADFGPAGTIARWVDAGTVAHLVCCTSGDAGADDPRTDPLALARLREAEQRAAAAIVGYASVTFLHHPDGALANDLVLREQLVRILRTHRPDAVLTCDPTVVIGAEGFIQHVDHRTAGLAAIDAVYPAARNAMAFPSLAIHEGLAPHAVPRLYLFWTEQPNAAVDVSATLARKLDALRAHASQLRDPEATLAAVGTWLAEAGTPLGCAAAETFRVLDLR